MGMHVCVYIYKCFKLNICYIHMDMYTLTLSFKCLSFYGKALASLNYLQIYS